MSGSISSVASTLVPQMMLGNKPYSATAKKNTSPFQTIDPDETNSISRSVNTPNAPENLQPTESNSGIDSSNLGGNGTELSHDSENRMAGLESSLTNSGAASERSDVPSSQSKNGSTKSFAWLGTPVATSGSPGSVVNVLT